MEIVSEEKQRMYMIVGAEVTGEVTVITQDALFYDIFLKGHGFASSLTGDNVFVGAEGLVDSFIHELKKRNQEIKSVEW